MKLIRDIDPGSSLWQLGRLQWGYQKSSDNDGYEVDGIRITLMVYFQTRDPSIKAMFIIAGNYMLVVAIAKKP